MRFSRWIRFTAMLMVSVLLSHQVAFAAKKQADPAAMKAKIQARGVGQGVRVVLADKTENRGLIVSVGDASFVLKPKKKDVQTVEIEYAQLAEVHKDRLSRGEKVTIAVVIVSAVVLVTSIVIVHKLNKPIVFNLPPGTF